MVYQVANCCHLVGACPNDEVIDQPSCLGRRMFRQWNHTPTDVGCPWIMVHVMTMRS